MALSWSISLRHVQRLITRTAILPAITRAQYSDKGDMHPAPPEIQEPTIPPYEEKVGEPLHLKRASTYSGQAVVDMKSSPITSVHAEPGIPHLINYRREVLCQHFYHIRSLSSSHLLYVLYTNSGMGEQTPHWHP
ncbi:uncharacterized protein LOC135099659 isoform X2 [Scylla paramamosain]|uniref:uncharacterized protein LOC135099659 isoform X2 n=1 Tax=Scylla paramamosain TaxID=85552 RepID=UPI003082C84E